MYNKQLYERVMKEISVYVKHKLNEVIRNPYDRYAEEDSYYDETINRLSIDVRDILNANVLDDNECKILINIVNKLQLKDIYYVYVSNDEITDDEELQDDLNKITSEKYYNKIHTYVYNEIDRLIKLECYDEPEQDDSAYERYAEAQAERNQFYRHGMEY